MGVKNAVVSNMTADRLSSMLAGYFDKVLVDAPCSGEGMFRKDKDAIFEWSPEHSQACAARQKEILDASAAAVVFCFVKQRAERSLGLLFSDDGRKTLHTRHILKQKRSRSQFFYHKKTSANSISRGFGIMMLFLR